MIKQKLQQSVVITEKEQVLKQKEIAGLVQRLKVAFDYKNYSMLESLLKDNHLSQFEQLKALITKRTLAIDTAQTILDEVLLND